MNVSVCMATHNGEQYLRQQIDSILSQLDEDDELIISDDNSSDDTLSILYSYKDSRIIVLEPKKFGSPSKNFERALTYCHNTIIFLADQDDIWHINKISVMKTALEKNDLVVCDCKIVDENLSILHDSFFSRNHSKSGLIKNFIKNSFIGCCMAFRKSVLAKSLPFPEDIPSHDQWIGLIAERYFTVAFIPEVLVDHRRHFNNYSSTGGQSETSLSDKIKFRFHLAKELLEH